MTEKCSTLTNDVADAAVRNLLRRIDDLPVIPAVAVQALTLSLKDDVDLGKLGGVVESDPILTAKMLRMVNNVQTGVSGKVGTVKQALALLGLKQVRCALLGVMFREYLPSHDPDISRASRRLWSHSLLCGVMAGLLIAKAHPELQEMAFVAGLVHDLGKVVILEVFPQQHAAIEAFKHDKRLSDMAAEQEILGINHCLAGKILARQWKLPDFMLDCIWLHHHTPAIVDQNTSDRRLLCSVVLANTFAHEVFCSRSTMDKNSIFMPTAMSLLDLSDRDIDQIKQAATADYSQKAGFFDLEGDLNSVFHGIVQKANQKLAQMGVELERKNDLLNKNIRVLDLAHCLGLKLGPVLNRRMLFEETANIFNVCDLVRSGLFYTVNGSRELDGVFWTERQRKRMLLCFLDKSGQPVWEYDDIEGIPAQFKTILGSHKDRAGGCAGEPYNIQDNFHIFSFQAESGLVCELCLLFDQDNRDDQEDPVLPVWDKIIFGQVVQILKACMERISYYEKLEKRTEDLSQALWKNQQMTLQLIQTERLAAVGQLAAGAAHEINNPLAIISARAQLLHLREEDEKSRKELTIISEQIDRISRILSNLMDFARPVPPRLQDVELHKVLDRVLELMASGFKNAKIVVRRQYDSTITTIRADPGQLEQVFLNLGINARHAMEAKGGALTVTTAFTSDRKNVRISIEDEGEGISPENLKKIFDPFFTTKEVGKGNGLGMSTSYGIINSHFGKIDIESQTGKGTTVRVELPVDIAGLRPCSENDFVRGPGAKENVRPRVLVVDDEAHIRDILREALESEDMFVDTAVNGQKGLEKLLNNGFDLLLLDIKMPSRDGLSLLREIRKVKKNLPVIVITGMASQEEMEEAIGHGQCKCMRKPFRINTLLAEIKDSLSPNSEYAQN